MQQYITGALGKMFKGFISYTRNDQEHVDALREGIIEQFKISGLECELWDDNQIPLGSEWHKTIETKLREVDFALLFVSNGFLSNTFIVEEEIKVFLKRKEEDPTFVIIPIVVKPCRYDSFENLRNYQFFIPDGDKVGLPQYNLVTFSHVYQLGSPYVDDYFQLLFDKIRFAILPHINAKKEMIEARLEIQNDKLYSWLKSNKAAILEESVQVITREHNIPLNSLQLIMETKWLFDALFSKVVTGDFEALKVYLAEEKYFQLSVYKGILKSFKKYVNLDILMTQDSKDMALGLIAQAEVIVEESVN